MGGSIVLWNHRQEEGGGSPEVSIALPQLFSGSALSLQQLHTLILLICFIFPTSKRRIRWGKDLFIHSLHVGGWTGCSSSIVICIQAVAASITCKNSILCYNGSFSSFLSSRYMNSFFVIIQFKQIFLWIYVNFNFCIVWTSCNSHPSVSFGIPLWLIWSTCSPFLCRGDRGRGRGGRFGARGGLVQG